MTHAAVSQELASLLSGVRATSPIQIDDLTFIPLVVAGDGPDAESLEEALEQGHTSIEEVSEGGSVNRVRVTHSGVRLLLLLDGEQVIGAKQNRIFNASFLVPPGVSVEVPVSCVERGRWNYTSPEFTSSGTTVTSVARSAKLRRVTESLSSNRGYDADQRAVWRDVDRYLENTQVSSLTGAFSDAFKQREHGVEQRLQGLSPLREQVGLAVVRGDRLVGLDLFASPSLYMKGWKKIARGVLAEVHKDRTSTADPLRVVDSALHELTQTRVVRTRAPGCGETLHGNSGRLVIGAVVHEGQVYHAVAAEG